MAFNLPAQQKSYSLDSPEAMLHDIRTKKIEGPLATQADIWREYQSTFYSKSDVAINLPTGAGKTLVGLAIAEWRRRKNNERVVFLCPTNQLVNQVVNQSREQYGIDCVGFTGSNKNYPTECVAKFRRNEVVAITTYSALFNNKPFFADSDILILDDAHAAENYIASMWSFEVNKSAEQSLYERLIELFESSLERIDFTKCKSANVHASSQYVDMLPLGDFWGISDSVKSIVDQEDLPTAKNYRWQNIREHLTGCCLYFSHKQILIRPFIPPTFTHDAFSKPKQRIYMSATLGSGGELERLTGRKKISQLNISGSERQGIGRRFFVFPELCSDSDAVSKILKTVLNKNHRVVTLSRSNTEVEVLRKWYDYNFTNGKFYDAKDIEDSKESFINSSPALAAVANRYDGMDFPGGECRFLFITGLPTAMNLQEKFLMTRMGCEVAFHDRIQTRIVQAVGRCTRSNNDYAAVIVHGNEWLDYLLKSGKSSFLHPELQAEINFGDSQSVATLANIEENIQHFLNSDEEWKAAEDVIMNNRDSLIKRPVDGEKELGRTVKHEINFSNSLWRGDFVQALSESREVLKSLDGGSALRGYRALWNYFSGSVIQQSERMNYLSSNGASIEFYQKASEAAKMIPWLISLVRARGETLARDSQDEETCLMVENIESKLLELGLAHNKNFDAHMDNIRKLLSSNEASNFEEGQRKLGELIGFTSGNIETQGAPDPWWILSKQHCVVFEDYTDADEGSAISINKARQAATHENWIRGKVSEISSETKVIPVIVSSASKLMTDADVHLKGVYFISTTDFRAWSFDLMNSIAKIRKTLTQQADLVWREESVNELKKLKMDYYGILSFLTKQEASDVSDEA